MLPSYIVKGAMEGFTCRLMGGVIKMMGAAAVEGYTIILYIHACRSMHDDDEQDKSQRKDYF